MTTNGKPVLVATDLSARTDRAVDRATQLARAWGVRLMVLHAIEPDSRLHARPELANEAMREVLPDPAADVDIVPALDLAPTAIVEAAKSGGCGLIVTGVARFNHVGDFFIGTAVDHVVRHATVPVLVVKRRPHNVYRTLLVATDYSSCSRLALLTAAELFPDAAIHLVHAYHVPYEAWLRSDEVREDVTREAQGELDAFVMDPAIPADVRERISAQIVYGETHSVLCKKADEHGADLLVLGTHGGGGFFPAVMGRMAESLLRCADLDTLVVRETP